MLFRSPMPSKLIECRLAEPLPSVLTYQYVSQIHTRYERALGSFPTGLIPSFNKWRMSQLHLLLQSVRSFRAEEAEALVDMVSFMPSETYFEVYASSCLIQIYSY
jgi:hypothetical protein